MSKLKNPLFSLSGKGGLGKAISFVRRGGRDIAEKKPVVPDAKSPAQLIWRHMYQKAVALWHALSEAEKQEWESLARPKHMTGFAWFISQALKPNPGLYLPLQGGKMQGTIDMDKYFITKLPEPVGNQDAATKKYHDDNLPPGGYTEGCKIYNTVSQTIFDGVPAYLTFNSEDYDTDGMHDPGVNPERITINTAGIYLITFHGHIQQNVNGERQADILRNTSIIARSRQDAETLTPTYFNFTTIFQLTIGQYLRVRIFQDSGGDLAIATATYYTPYFMAQRIG